MGKILTKPYKHWPVGLVVTTDAEEWMKGVAARRGKFGLAPGEPFLVNAERMAQLEREGYFDVL